MANNYLSQTFPTSPPLKRLSAVGHSEHGKGTIIDCCWRECGEWIYQIRWENDGSVTWSVVLDADE